MTLLDLLLWFVFDGRLLHRHHVLQFTLGLICCSSSNSRLSCIIQTCHNFPWLAPLLGICYLYLSGYITDWRSSGISTHALSKSDMVRTLLDDLRQGSSFAASAIFSLLSPFHLFRPPLLLMLSKNSRSLIWSLGFTLIWTM